MLIRQFDSDTRLKLIQTIMRNLLIILTITLVVSCVPSTTERPKWKEIECPECHGTGKVKASAGDRIALGLITFGMGAMVDTKQCVQEAELYTKE